MVDSVAVFPAGYRLTDNTTGDPISGAVIRFFDAETSTPKIVYADADLLVELGTTVTTDSLGAPTSNGTTKTDIYVGTAPYKIRVETSTGVEIETKDNRPGAVVSDTGTSAAVDFVTPVVTKSLDYPVLAADQSTFFKVNCASADVTLTLPSAVTVGDGWFIEVQQVANSNQALIATVSSQTISRGGKSYGTSFSMTNGGEYVWLVSNGGNWDIKAYAPPFFTPGVGVITVIDRVSSAPGAPVQGGIYLVTSAYSTFSVGDLIQYTGASYIAFTPYTDCGWIAYVQDENLNYQFKDSAWVVQTATTALEGTVRLADQAAMEAETAGRVPTADVLKNHPGVAKAWIVFNGTGTPAIVASYNITSITDNGTGDYTINIGTDFSSASYAWCWGVNLAAGDIGYVTETSKAAGSLRITVISGGVAADVSRITLTFFGDQ